MLVSLATYLVAATLIILLPGPDTLVVVRNLVRGGRSVAVRTVLGVLSDAVQEHCFTNAAQAHARTWLEG